MSAVGDSTCTSRRTLSTIASVVGSTSPPVLYGAGVSIDPATALADACARAGVEIRLLHDLSDLNVARRIFDEVWPADDTQMQPNVMRALTHAGGYCSAAFIGNEPVGAALGFIGRHREADGWEVHLHSHMAAVREDFRDRHIGTALKLHQRVWALEQGIPVIVWTFDPLVRRNARLNLLKLGVEVRGFEPDFYGEMSDGINSGDPTDRLFAWWVVDSALADAAANGALEPIRADVIAAHPQCRVIELPDDIVALREVDPAAAREWRLRLRHELVDAFAEGLAITGITEDGGYVLWRSA
jgi:predicted GNAT superfamily acetyltransferase